LHPFHPSADDADADTAGLWVADVSLALANGRIIRQYQHFAQLLLAVRRARSKVQKYGPHSRFHSERRLQRAMAELEAVESQLADVGHQYTRDVSNRVVGAFVTFNNEESMHRCLADYAGSGLSLNILRRCQPDPLKLRGKPISVRQAPVSVQFRCRRWVGWWG
jgi:hypothetical protein